ncbi:hypothetical protein D9M68_875640 [compost metagenome]
MVRAVAVGLAVPYRDHDIVGLGPANGTGFDQAIHCVLQHIEAVGKALQRHHHALAVFGHRLARRILHGGRQAHQVNAHDGAGYGDFPDGVGVKFALHNAQSSCSCRLRRPAC